ncbi:MAG: hypothetical protein ACREJQ_06075, partial [bacterium]
MHKNQWSEQEWAVFIEQEVHGRLAEAVQVPNLTAIQSTLGGVIEAHFRRGDFSRDLLISLNDMKEEIA